MGYIIVGSEDGISIVDPHGGSWAERTQGWPRSLSTSTSPALTDNDIDGVCAGFAQQPAHDPRTGGPMPTFGAYYGTSADVSCLIKDNGTVIDFAGSDVTGAGVAIMDGQFYHIDNSNGRLAKILAPIDAITADDSAGASVMNGETGYPEAFDLTNISASGGKVVGGGGNGFTGIISNASATEATARGIPSFKINRTYNTGYMVGDIRGAWLANSKTVDRSYKANTLTEVGTVASAAVETSAELTGYGPFPSGNYFHRAADTDYNSFGTASFCAMAWVKQGGTMSSDFDVIACVEDPSTSSAKQWTLRWEADGALGFQIGDGTATKHADSVQSYEDGNWHFMVGVKVGTSDCLLYVDGVLVSAVGSGLSKTLTDTNAVFVIGTHPATSFTNRPNTTGLTTLVRVSATEPTATQVRQMYEAEKGMFEANAKCLLQSSSTDAVLDVDVDKISGKVAVTQTDSVTIWDGLVVESEPTIATGGTTWEHTKLFGEKRVEINDANLFYTAPAEKLREVAEVVRGMGSKLPKGVDLGKAKAWCIYDGTNQEIDVSFNIDHVIRETTGKYRFYFKIPMKNDFFPVVGGGQFEAATTENWQASNTDKTRMVLHHVDSAGAGKNSTGEIIIAFGELENE
jgi:hypothetical protein